MSSSSANRISSSGRWFSMSRRIRANRRARSGSSSRPLSLARFQTEPAAFNSSRTVSRETSICVSTARVTARVAQASAHSTPAQDAGRKLDQRAKHPLPATQAWRGLAISLPIQFARAVGSERAIDAGARAEEEIGDLSRVLPGGAEEQDVNREEMTITGSGQFT